MLDVDGAEVAEQVGSTSGGVVAVSSVTKATMLVTAVEDRQGKRLANAIDAPVPSSAPDRPLREDQRAVCRDGTTDASTVRLSARV